MGSEMDKFPGKWECGKSVLELKCGFARYYD